MDAKTAIELLRYHDTFIRREDNSIVHLTIFGQQAKDIADLIELMETENSVLRDAARLGIRAEKALRQVWDETACDKQQDERFVKHSWGMLQIVS